jgi:GntR family transcriptional regulator, regulator for abcA and norABC
MIELNWKTDKSSPIPLYIQIKEYIKEKIETGEWTVGTKIPPQRTLAQAFGVNRSTVVAAVEERLADIKMQTDYGSSSLSQWAVAEWLSSGLYHQHLEEVRKELKIRREVMINSLQKYFSDIAAWSVPKGGFYIWLRILPSLSIRKLFEKALERGILLNPGIVYDQRATQYLRLSYSYASLADLDKGIFRLSEVIRQLIS